MFITYENDGPRVTATNYWDTPLAARGLIHCSVNAGCIRIMVPDQIRNMIQAARESVGIIYSRGPWPAQKFSDAVEIMIEDHTDSPFVVHTTIDQWLLLPTPGTEWTTKLYTAGLVEQITLPSVVRRVTEIPCMQPHAKFPKP